MLKEIEEKIWQTTSETPGKHIVIIGGTHGNELTGVHVVEKLREAIQAGEESVTAGTLTLILGNPEAIKIQKRGSKPHQDLNRCFGADRLSSAPDGTYEDARARIMASILSKADVSIDLHAVNKRSIAFLACANSPEHQKISKWFTADRILTDPDFILGGAPVTTDEFVDQNGGIGICYETGWVEELGVAEEVYKSIINILKDQRVITGAPQGTASQAKKDVYQMHRAIKLTSPDFRFSAGFGKESYEPVLPGDIVAYQNEEPVKAGVEGVTIFPKREEHWNVGEPACYIARKLS